MRRDDNEIPTRNRLGSKPLILDTQEESKHPYTFEPASKKFGERTRNPEPKTSIRENDYNSLHESHKDQLMYSKRSSEISDTPKLNIALHRTGGLENIAKNLRSAAEKIRALRKPKVPSYADKEETDEMAPSKEDDQDNSPESEQINEPSSHNAIEQRERSIVAQKAEAQRYAEDSKVRPEEEDNVKEENAEEQEEPEVQEVQEVQKVQEVPEEPEDFRILAADNISIVLRKLVNRHKISDMKRSFKKIKNFAEKKELRYIVRRGI